jgi:High potential iron-sulfur protein
MQYCNRRTFTIHALQVAAASSALAANLATAAEESAEKVTEVDPYAKSMGFRVDTAQVDQAKYPRHEVSQHCSECQLYSGKAGEPTGACSFYGGRLVPINGWCRNFKVRKAKA